MANDHWERVLDYADRSSHRARSADATHSSEIQDPYCGDRIHIQLTVDAQGMIRQASYTGQGCVVSQAAAAMLVEHIEQKSVTDAAAFDAQDMLVLFSAPLTPQRRKCCLLAWRVLQAALARHSSSP